MTLLGQLKQDCLREINEAWDFARDRYGVLLHHVPVNFSNALHTCAGKCYLDLHGDTPVAVRIDLSTEILINEGQNFVARTPKHEAAHAIAWVVYRDRGHGQSWHHVARELGIDDSRCHRYAVRKRPTRRTEVLHCACDQPHTVTPQKVQKIRTGKIKVYCRTCREFLKP